LNFQTGVGAKPHRSTCREREIGSDLTANPRKEPYLEAKEHLVGYCMIECDFLDRALEVAATWPDARWMGIEVRPVMTPGGEEM
jgi:hypothetical protein